MNILRRMYFNRFSKRMDKIVRHGNLSEILAILNIVNKEFQGLDYYPTKTMLSERIVKFFFPSYTRSSSDAYERMRELTLLYAAKYSQFAVLSNISLAYTTIPPVVLELCLYNAIRNGRDDIVATVINSALFNEYINNNVYEGKYSRFIDTASLYGQQKVAILLIKSGAIISIKCLYNAISNGHLGIASFYIASGINVNEEYQNGLTLLQWLKTKRTYVVDREGGYKLLRDAGARE